MCRLVIYKGAEIPISRLIFDPPHSVFKQSFDAKEMLSGNMNADGFGIGWYNHALNRSPAVYTNTAAIWNDFNAPRIMNKISSGLIFAHVRGASDGMPVTMTNTHPFAYRNFVFMHNGAIDEFPELVFPEIAGRINSRLWAHVKGNTDSEHFFALWLSHLDWKQLHSDKGVPLKAQIAALRETIRFLETIAKKKKIEMVLNLGISDGENIIAARYHFGKRKATLYVIGDSKRFPRSKIIASEKLFADTRWKTVPERSLVAIDKKNNLSIQSL